MTLTEKEAPAAEPPLGPDPTPTGNPVRVVQLLAVVALDHAPGHRDGQG